MCVCVRVVCLLSDTTKREKGGRSPNLHSVVHAKSGWFPMLFLQVWYMVYTTLVATS